MNKAANYLYETAIESYNFQTGILLPGHFVKPYGFHAHRNTGRKDWLLIYTNSGCGQLRVGENILNAHEGEAVFIPPGIPQHYATAVGEIWDFLWVHFLPRPHWLHLLGESNDAMGLIHVSVTEPIICKQIQSDFQRILQETEGQNVWKEEIMLHSLESIILQLAQVTSSTKRSSKLDTRIDEVLCMLYQNAASCSPTVEELANKVSLSCSRLAHLFKEEVGHSLKQHLIQYRLKKAAQLLQFTSLRVEEVALHAGFSSVYYFSRQFKVHYGVSPSMYKR